MRADPSRFDRVAAHPEYGTAPNEPVLPADASVGVSAIAAPLSLSLFGIVFLLIAITLLVEIQPPLAFSIIFIGGALVFILGGLGTLGKIYQFRNAPIARCIAVIIKERTEVTGGGEDRSASTSYYTTLQMRDGTRIEYLTYRSLVGRVAVGDIGVAYVKAHSLVEFIRFDVD